MNCISLHPITDGNADHCGGVGCLTADRLGNSIFYKIGLPFLFSFKVIANQSADWCGNPLVRSNRYRFPLLLKMGIAASLRSSQ